MSLAELKNIGSDGID